MISKNIASLLENDGFSYYTTEDKKNSYMFALYKGYGTTINEISGKLLLYFNFKFAENDENNLKKYNISNFISNIASKYSIIDYDLNEDGLRIKASTDEILSLLDEVAQMLQSHDIRGIEYCSECGNKFGTRNPKKVDINSECHIMCEHCAIMAIEEYSTDNKPVSDVKPNIKKGVLGSLLFAFIGAIIIFIANVFLVPWINGLKLGDVRYILCALGFVTALLSYIGYNLFSKTISFGTYIAISVNGILFTAIGQFFGTIFGFISNGGYALESICNKHFWLIHLRNTIPDEASDQFTNLSAEFYQLLGISLSFAIVGVAIFVLTLRDKNKPVVRKINVETLKIQ